MKKKTKKEGKEERNKEDANRKESGAKIKKIKGTLYKLYAVYYDELKSRDNLTIIM